MKKDKKMIYTIAGIFICLFALLIGYLIYITVAKQKSYAIHSQNSRLNSLESEVVRGDIYDANLQLLATNDEMGRRYYPYGSLYAHVVGYSQSGKIGIEAQANQQLLYPNYDISSIINIALFNGKVKGRDIVLTLDHDYQQAAADGLAGKRGGVVVMDPNTGAIKAMYSSPTFDPNDIVENWSALNTDTDNTPLINRAAKGLYPPGSIFKVITTLAYMRSSEALDFTYDCNGRIAGDNYSIKCFNETAHGHEDLAEAFSKSCNAYFIALARTLPEDALRAAAEAVGFNQSLEVDFDYSKSRFSLNSDKASGSSAIATAFEQDATAIGQGKTLTTPLHMAMLAATIANDGLSMKPYLIQYSMDGKRRTKMRNEPIYDEPLMTEAQAIKLQSLMEWVVDHGTAVSLPEKGLVVGGKTGTAENETEADHSWFLGYAKDPSSDGKDTIAFAIVVEGGGKGAQSLDVANEILEAYRNKLKLY